MKVTIIVGNIGTGKSTWVKENCKDSLVWNNDCLREMFHCGEYVFDRSENRIFLVLRNNFIDYALDNNIDIVIDDTNLLKLFRTQIINRIRFGRPDAWIECVDFGIGNEKTLQRRLDEARGNFEWKEVHERFQNMYEEPNLDEGMDKIINVENY